MTVTDDAPIAADDLAAALPPEWPDATIREQVRARLAESGEVVVSLDDDPTGVQTVHGIYALTEWSPEALRREFAEPSALFAVLTNSRAQGPAQAAAIAREVAAGLAEASRQTGRLFAV